MAYPFFPVSTRTVAPSWPGLRDEDRDGEDTLLRPITHETSRSQWASESSGLSTGSRNDSVVDTVEPSESMRMVRQQEPRSTEDLEEAKRRRKQGEEALRSALSSIGSLATDITRRLDYTYYSLLERFTALTSTIASFRELSTSTTHLFNDFERETAGLDQELRKQLGELKGFQPQTQKVESLEGRMKAGRQKAEALGERLENIRSEIESWERREAEWQACVGRRLRILWSVVAGSILVFLVAMAVQSWPASKRSLDPEVLLQSTANRHAQHHWSYSPGLADRATCQGSSVAPTFTDQTTREDPLRILDGL